MAGAKETPRQKMIGMMYLVLTALLALNISKEVLDGFVKVDNSLRTTQGTLNAKVAETYNDLDAKYTQNQEKVKPFFDKANEVNDAANNMIAYITEMKAEIMAASTKTPKEGIWGKDENGRDTVLNLKYVAVKDEYQIVTTFTGMGNPKDPQPGQWTALELREKLEAFKNELKTVSVTDVQGRQRDLPQYLLDQIDETFAFEGGTVDGEPVSWEHANFYHIPLAALMPLMTKMTLDIQDIQEDILAWLLGSVDAKSYKFTTLVPLVVPESNYIMKGDTFRANVLLAAYDETNAPAIYVDNEKWNGADSSALNYEGIEALPIGSDGLGKLKIDTRGLSLGDASFKGLIRYQGPDGSIEEFPYVTPAFTVAEPALVVSATKMQVFYRGVDNPVKVSVPGVPAEKLNVSISGGHSVSRASGGTYTVKPGSGGKATFTVSATLPDGTEKRITSDEFRVLPLPTPDPVIGKIKHTDSQASKSDIVGEAGMRASMGDDFAFDFTPRVTSYKMSVNLGGKSYKDVSSDGWAISKEQKTYLNALKKGDIVMFHDIKAKLPDGRTVKLANISLNIK